MKSHSESYKAAGVDITAGYEAVRLMGQYVKQTQTPGAISPIGGFGGLFQPDFTGMQTPVLVSGTDGVGTKLKIAFMLDKHDTVGIDCVAMSVNDVVCAGARPLFFLDYIATGKINPQRVADIVKGVSAGCVEAGCALIGGETAEMPGFYQNGEYDLAGFAVGLADKSGIIDRDGVCPGDILLALPSSGVHSNGFSLTRKVFGLDDNPRALGVYMDELSMTLGEALLTPTRIYAKPVLALLARAEVKGIAHITGGGFYENMPRALPGGLGLRVEEKAIKTPPIFSLIEKTGGIPRRDMFNTYNMGVGMSVIVAPAQADRALSALREAGLEAYAAGEVTKGGEGVVLC